MKMHVIIDRLKKCVKKRFIMKRQGKTFQIMKLENSPLVLKRTNNKTQAKTKKIKLKNKMKQGHLKRFNLLIEYKHFGST